MIGAIGGWLCTTQKPSKAPSPQDFRSGSYKRYGFNVQLVSGSRLRIICMCAAAPGKAGDARAFGRMADFRKWLQELPDECFIVGDNAYPLSRKILVPFSGPQKQSKWKSA